MCVDLLQYTYGDFYMHVLSDDARYKTFPMVDNANIKYLYGNQTKWYMYQSTAFKTWTLLILMALCYLVQKYFQDGLVSWLYGRYIQRSMEAAAAATRQPSPLHSSP
jgi:hypothetical protein